MTGRHHNGMRPARDTHLVKFSQCPWRAGALAGSCNDAMSKHARRLPLAAEYHDGQVESIDVGPRREVTVTVRLDPVWNNGDYSTRRLHFSAIHNFEEVAAFFRRGSLARGEVGYIDEVIRIVRASKGIVGLELASLGYVEMRGAKVSES